MASENSTTAQIQRSWNQLCSKVSRNTTDNPLIKAKMTVMILIGVVTCLMAVHTVYQDHFVYSRWTRTTAQVVSIDAFTVQGRKKAEEHYRYTLRYSDGQHEWTKTNETPAKPGFSAGQQVPVAFDPDDTQSVRLNFGDTDHFALFLFIMGAAFIVFPGFLIYKKEGRPEMTMTRKVFIVACGLFFASMASAHFDLNLATMFMTFCIMLGLPSLALLALGGMIQKANRKRGISASKDMVERRRPLK